LTKKRKGGRAHLQKKIKAMEVQRARRRGQTEKNGQKEGNNQGQDLRIKKTETKFQKGPEKKRLSETESMEVGSV